MNLKRNAMQVAAWSRDLFQLRNLWVLMPGALAILLVYAVQPLDEARRLLSKQPLEILALWLTSIIMVIFVAKSLRGKNPLMIYMAALVLIFLVRELDDTELVLFGLVHDVESKRLVVIALVGMALWAFAWREKLIASLDHSSFLRTSFFGVVWTYIFSQLVAHRAFKGILPNERKLHVPFEETTETAAHLFLLAFAIGCYLFLSDRRIDEEGRREPEPGDSPEGAGTGAPTA